MGSQWDRAEGENHLPPPAGHTFCHAAHRGCGLLGNETHCQDMLSFSSINIHKIFSTGLISIHIPCILYFCLRLPRCIFFTDSQRTSSLQNLFYFVLLTCACTVFSSQGRFQFTHLSNLHPEVSVRKKLEQRSKTLNPFTLFIHSHRFSFIDVSRAYLTFHTISDSGVLFIKVKSCLVSSALILHKI